jgi:hypothetical protein
MMKIDTRATAEIRSAAADVRLSLDRLHRLMRHAAPGLLSAFGSAETVPSGLALLDDLLADRGEDEEG